MFIVLEGIATNAEFAIDFICDIIKEAHNATAASAIVIVTEFNVFIIKFRKIIGANVNGFSGVISKFQDSTFAATFNFDIVASEIIFKSTCHIGVFFGSSPTSGNDVITFHHVFYDASGTSGVGGIL